MRGDIYASDGTVLATTDTADDGTETRVYPQKKLFGHVIGYNSKTKMGIESTENYYLLSETDNIFDQISNDLTGEKAELQELAKASTRSCFPCAFPSAQGIAIGQGKTMISPLHNLMIAATVANDGTMLTPYLVEDRKSVV